MKSLKKPVRKFILFTTCLLFILSTFSSNAAISVSGSQVQTQKISLYPDFAPPVSKKINIMKIVDGVKFITPDILLTKLEADAGKSARRVRQGTVLVLVNSGIYPDVKNSILTYTQDLSIEGYTTKVYTVTGKDPIQLKSFIRSCWFDVYNEFYQGKLSESAFRYGTGVFIVGDLPVPLVHSRSGEYTDDNGVKKPYEGTFVCDLYLTDMDGNWNYTDENGIPFISTVDPGIIPADSECTPSDFIASKWKPGYKAGRGGAKPEIWMGRLAVSPEATVNGVYNRSSEVNMITEYFKRNHAYRHGWFPYVPANESGEKYAARDRILYYDDPWASFAPQIMNSFNSVWPGPIVHDNEASSVPVNRYINSENITSHTDYLSRLPQYTLWIEFLAHSNPWYHEFVKWAYNYTKKEYEWQDVGWLSCEDISQQTKNALFYNIQGCDACDYRQERYMGGTYLLRGNALAVVGNTTVGPHDSGTLYAALGLGANIGFAYMLNQMAFGTENWITNMVSSTEGFDSKRYYGQTLLGDPTLKPIAFIPKHEPYSISHGLTDYSRLSTIYSRLPLKSNLKSVADIVKQKVSAEARDKLKKIIAMPVKGFEYLKPNPNKIIRDPQFDTFIKLSGLATKITYELTIDPKSLTLAAGNAVQFTGSLTSKKTLLSIAGTTASPVRNASVELYEIAKSGTTVSGIALVAKGITDGTGKYLIKITPAAGVHTYKVIYRNAAGEELASSDEALITITRALRILPRVITR